MAKDKNGSKDKKETNKAERSFSDIAKSVKALNAAAQDITNAFGVEPALSVEPASRKKDDNLAAEKKVRQNLTVFIQKHMAPEDAEALSSETMAMLTDTASDMPAGDVPQALHSVFGIKAPEGKGKQKNTAKSGGSKAKKEKKAKGPGVISTIVETVKKGTKKSPVSKADILAALEEAFPDRDPEAMKKTINVQVPTRINKERDFTLEKNDAGAYYVARGSK